MWRRFDPSSHLPRWVLLLGALVGVPLAVAALVAGLTAAASCDTNGLVILAAGAVAAIALGSAWAFGYGARGWWLFGCVVTAGTFGILATLVAWLEVAFDRCFTF
jgi:hypothetical protein